MKRGYSVETVEEDEHFELNTHDKNENNPLNQAVERGNLQQVEALVTQNRNALKILDECLGIALKKIRIEYIMYQFSAERDKSKHLKYNKIATILLLAGASLSSCLEDRCPVELMHSAVLSNDLDFLQTLLNAGLDINSKGESHRSLLHLTVRYRPSDLPLEAPSLVGNLLKLGANHSIKCKISGTPLHLVTNPSDANALLEGGANIEALDKQRSTPLFSAALHHRLAVFNFLISKGADPFHVNGQDLNLMNFAKMDKRKDNFPKTIKDLLSYPPSFLLQATKFLSNLISQSMKMAIAQGKKLLILLGESHGQYRTYQIYKLILQIAKKNNIIHLMKEHLPQDIKKEDFKEGIPLLRYNKKHIGLNVVGMDKYKSPDDDDEWKISREGVERRNVGMVETMQDTNEHAISIIGSYHLLGILELLSQTNIPPYFIVPINFCNCCEHGGIDHEFELEEIFKNDQTKIIQFCKGIFDVKQAENVICTQNQLPAFTCFEV